LPLLSGPVVVISHPLCQPKLTNFRQHWDAGAVDV